MQGANEMSLEGRCCEQAMHVMQHKRERQRCNGNGLDAISQPFR